MTWKSKIRITGRPPFLARDRLTFTYHHIIIAAGLWMVFDLSEDQSSKYSNPSWQHLKAELRRNKRKWLITSGIFMSLAILWAERSPLYAPSKSGELKQVRTVLICRFIHAMWKNNSDIFSATLSDGTSPYCFRQYIEEHSTALLHSTLFDFFNFSFSPWHTILLYSTSPYAISPKSILSSHLSFRPVGRQPAFPKTGSGWSVQRRRLLSIGAQRRPSYHVLLRCTTMWQPSVLWGDYSTCLPSRFQIIIFDKASELHAWRFTSLIVFCASHGNVKRCQLLLCQSTNAQYLQYRN